MADQRVKSSHFYRVHKGVPLVPVLRRQMDTFHILTSHSCKNPL
jgi:hypothetical protein